MELTCYPTYGYKDQSGAWKVSLRVFVHQNRFLGPLLERSLEPAAVEFAEQVSRQAPGHRIDRDAARTSFKERIAYFLREGVADQEVAFEFYVDPNTRPSPVSLTANKDGLIDDDITLDEAKVPGLAGDGDRWLNYRAVAEGVAATGRIRLLGAQGLSVISDIDDTIKITEIPAGVEIVALNTFFRPFASVTNPDNMVEMYKGRTRTPGNSTLDPLNAKLSFHYVSGGPWQLYEPLAAYLIDQSEFPAGTFHLRTVHLENTALGAWKALVNLVQKAFAWKDVVELTERVFDFASTPSVQEDDTYKNNETYKHKIKVIQKLMGDLPGRKYIMFGDSGEYDPEVYETILNQAQFRPMVAETSIRDVKGLAANNSRRQTMVGHNIIVRDAPPILHRKFQL
jgi:phosphatidate phosphatase APP1